MSNFTEDLAAVAGEFGVTPENRKPRASKRPYFRWTEEMIEKLVDLIDQQKTAEEIAAALSIPVERVKSKLQALKAKVPSVKPEKAEPKSENAPKTHAEPKNTPETHAEPPIALDCVIFDAFCEFCGRIDDYERTATNWRKALNLMESYLRDQFGTICGCPDTAKHFAAIAATLAQNEIKA